MNNAFIRIENTFEKAMYSRTSPQMRNFSFKGIQLLPNNPLPYIQRTFADGGINLENPNQVFLYDMCGDFVADITSYFLVLNTFQDPETGFNQIEWQLKRIFNNVLNFVDLGQRLVYMRIRQGINVYFYSSPFVLSGYNSEYTSRWDYRDLKNGTTYSTQLCVWFKQLLDLEEITTYDTLQGRRVGMNSSLIPYEAWQTSIVDINLFRLIKQMRQNTYVYVDLAKTVPFEPFETPRLVAQENFAEAEILLSRDETILYDPLYVEPVPPEPVINPRSITLSSVSSLNPNQVKYVFFTNYSPTALTLQYSVDQINWSSNTGSIFSPRTNNVPNNTTTNYFYRVADLVANLFSNVLQLRVTGVTINNVTSPDTQFTSSGNKYTIYYTLSNLVNSIPLAYEISTDGINWVNANYVIFNNNGVQQIQAIPSGVEFKYFRIKYGSLGAVSNTYNFYFQ